MTITILNTSTNTLPINQIEEHLSELPSSDPEFYDTLTSIFRRFIASTDIPSQDPIVEPMLSAENKPSFLTLSLRVDLLQGRIAPKADLDSTLLQIEESREMPGHVDYEQLCRDCGQEPSRIARPSLIPPHLTSDTPSIAPLSRLVVRANAEEGRITRLVDRDVEEGIAHPSTEANDSSWSTLLLTSTTLKEFWGMLAQDRASFFLQEPAALSNFEQKSIRESLGEPTLVDFIYIALAKKGFEELGRDEADIASSYWGNCDLQALVEELFTKCPTALLSKLLELVPENLLFPHSEELFFASYRPTEIPSVFEQIPQTLLLERPKLLQEGIQRCHSDSVSYLFHHLPQELRISPQVFEQLLNKANERSTHELLMALLHYVKDVADLALLRPLITKALEKCPQDQIDDVAYVFPESLRNEAFNLALFENCSPSSLLAILELFDRNYLEENPHFALGALRALNDDHEESIVGLYGILPIFWRSNEGIYEAARSYASEDEEGLEDLLKLYQEAIDGNDGSPSSTYDEETIHDLLDESDEEPDLG